MDRMCEKMKGLIEGKDLFVFAIAFEAEPRGQLPY